MYDNNNLLYSDSAQNLIFNNFNLFDTLLLCLESKIITSLDSSTCVICDDVFFDGNNWVFLNLSNPLSADFSITNNNRIIYKRLNMLGQEVKGILSEPTIIIYVDGTIEKVMRLIK